MPSTTRAVALLLACLVALGGARGRAFADDPRDDARRAFMQGEAAFRNGDYQGAIVYFRTSDAIAPSPVASYDIALAYERLGKPLEAAKSYEEYLERAPSAPNRTLVEQRIAQLRGEDIAKAKMRTPELYEPPNVAAPADDAPPINDDPPEDPFWQRIPTKPAGPPPPAPTPDGPFARDAPLPPEPTLAAAPPPGGNRVDGGASKGDDPVYKKWWFWAILGVSAIVLYDAATTDGDPPVRQTGATLLSF